MNRALEEKPIPAAEVTPWDPREVFVLPAVRSWGMVLFTTIVGAGIGTFLALTKPNEYTSVAKIAVRAGQRQMIPVDSVPDDARRGFTAISYYLIPDEIELINSEEVYDAVARKVGPAKILAPYDPAAKDHPNTPLHIRKLHEFQSWWFHQEEEIPVNEATLEIASDVVRSVNINSRGELSSVITIGYTHHDPELAKEIVDAFVEAHDERHQEIYSLKDDLEIWQQKRDQYDRLVQEAETELYRFESEKELFDPSTQSAGLTTNKKALEWQIEEARKTLEYQYEKQAKLEAELASLPKTWERPNPDPVLQAINQSLYEKQTQLQERLTEYDDDAPEIKRLRKQIAQLESQKAEMPEYIDPNMPFEQYPNPEWVEANDRLETLVDQIGENVVRTDVRVKYLEWINGRLEEIAALTPRLEELKRKVDKYKELSESYQTAIDEYDLAALLEERKVSNLRTIQAATLPLDKSGPNRQKLCFAGMAAGLIIGAALAALRNAFNRTIRRPKELQSFLNVPLLAVVPATGGWRRARRRLKLLPPQ